MLKHVLLLIILVAASASSPASGAPLRPGDFVMIDSWRATTTLVAFDGASMNPTVLASGGPMFGATDLAVRGDGTVLLAVPGTGIVRFSPGTGEQSVIATPAVLGEGTPSGIAVGPDGTVCVSIQGAVPRVVQLSAPGEFLRVVISGGYIPLPAGMCFGLGGELYVCATSIYGGGGIVQVDLATGTQTVIAGGGPLKGPFCVAAAPDGTLWSAQYGTQSQRLNACVVRTRVSDGYSEVLSVFGCTAYGVAVRGDGTALVGDCYRIHSDCMGGSSVFTQVYPSGEQIWGYSGPVAVVPFAPTGASRTSWGQLKTLYR